LAYDLHIVRSKHWADSSQNPITRAEVDTLIEADPELEWSTSDCVEMADSSGEAVRYFMILWQGHPCFWWYKDQLLCSGPNEDQQRKLVEVARSLNAFAVGDDGERYELRKTLFGKPKVVMVGADA
jgi:hypothetical protein